jgi:hypothetical protein
VGPRQICIPIQDTSQVISLRNLMSRFQRFQNYAMHRNTNIKWVVGHGEYTNVALDVGSFKLPPGVFVSFVSEPGRMLQDSLLHHQTFNHMYRSVNLTRKYIRKEIPKNNLPSNLHYFYGENPRIYGPGNWIPNLQIGFFDAPSGLTRTFFGVKSLTHHSKAFTNISHNVHLSDVIRRPGIYFIIACRITSNSNNKWSGRNSLSPRPRAARAHTISNFENRLAETLRKRARNNTTLRKTHEPPAKKRTY